MLSIVVQERQAACTGQVMTLYVGDTMQPQAASWRPEMRPVSEQSQMARNASASSGRGVNRQVVSRLMKLAPMTKSIRRQQASPAMHFAMALSSCRAWHCVCMPAGSRGTPAIACAVPRLGARGAGGSIAPVQQQGLSQQYTDLWWVQPSSHCSPY